VYLAYTDDSGTRDRAAFQVVSSLIVKDTQIRYLEALAGVLAYDLLPEDRREQFEEFHAWALYEGCEIFDGINQTNRFDAIKILLQTIESEKIPIVYGAVDKAALSRSLYATADPIDVCFQVCMQGVEQWIAQSDNQALGLLIIDDFEGNKDIKKTCRQAFRKFRKRLRSIIVPVGEAWHLHDDMYFGSSVDSVGIQMADLCSFFIRKHHDGNDPVAETFYQMFQGRIVYSQLLPGMTKPQGVAVDV